MDTISSKTIDRTWREISEATPEESERLAAEFTRQQPFVVAYLMAVEETCLEDEWEKGRLLEIAAFLWKALSAGRPPLRQVSTADIEAAEAANIRFLEDLEEGSEMAYLEAMEKLAATYNQMPLLKSVIEALLIGNEEEPELAGDDVGTALLHLKTVLDCLDQ
jgi:hypothetical protein